MLVWLGASSASAGTADAGAQLGVTRVRLPFARVALERGRLDVVLSAAPFLCDAGFSPPEPYASFTVPPGPGGAHYEGQPVGVEGFLNLGDGGSELVAPHLGEATLERDGGGSARGTFRFGRAGVGAAGRFEAPVCDLQEAGERPPVLPRAAPEGALVLDVAGTQVTVKSARAWLEGAGAELHLGALHVVFVNPRKLHDVELEPSVTLELEVKLAGASGASQRALLATPQPVWGNLGGRGNWGGFKGRGLPRPAWSGEGHGWVRFTKVGFTPGSTVEGELVLDFGAFGGKGGGRFKAVVEAR